MKNRSHGNSFFRNGSDSLDDWGDFIPVDEDLRIVNPRKGFIATANNKYASDNLKHHHSVGMITTARATRINAMLEEKISQGHKFTVEEMKKMQFDVKDCYAERGIKWVVAIAEKVGSLIRDESERNTIQNLLNILKEWDYNMDANSLGALIFEVWEMKFQGKILKKIQDLRTRQKVVFSFFLDHFIFRKLEEWATGRKADDMKDDEEWCTFKNTIPKEFRKHGCTYLLTVTFLEVDSFLTGKLGPDSSKWTWGRLHQQKFKHVPFSETALKYFYERKFPFGGKTKTVYFMFYLIKI
jgi:penicillin amidase